MTQVIGGVERLMREDLKPALAQEIREELRKEVWQEVRQEIQQELREEVRQAIRPEIKQESRREMIQALLKVRFGELDESLLALVAVLSQLPDEEGLALGMTFSQEELIARFGRSSN
jgi:hypothetical protein